MNYKEIENRFKDETTIETLLMDYEETFKIVDEDAMNLQQGNITPGEVEDLLKRQTGIYMRLNIIAEIADTTKKKEEGRLTYEKIQNAEKKPVMTQVSAEVSHEVQYLRRVRNLFQAYRNSSDKCVLSCQSILKKAQRNMNTGME